MNSLTTQRILLGFAVLATLTFEVFAVMAVIHGISDGWIDNPFEITWAISSLAGPLIALPGLFLTQRLPWLGGTMVVGGAIPMGAMFYWFPPFWALAAAVAAIGVLRARRFTAARALAS